ncbi:MULTISPECIES: hypothetical protein [Klebsiella pneumoniae complex]|uniref:hypothetical protein n=1 Tax=Klebsiella pneumoniae complex TaxID=3390273 RepID=UPI001C82B400|nr:MULTISPECIES: hypothetical protein [Klebsiella]MBX4840242.1 hypothetical protein [Klebsiella quasipneumoniae]HBS6246823.1 hypothetical protein [Klebsiella pneumoniae]HBW4568752.1 hypothetical protein [Klebsiella pneumoniae]HBW4689682.1 hypothetical protein [Klebsiella pneumoniae]HBW4773092.1 hypothetical protein [Klebsiella pneumoniae]
MTRNSLPQLPHGYRYGDEHSIHPHNDGDYFAPQGCVIKSVNLVDGVVIYVPIQRYIKHLDLWVNAEGTVE